MASLVKHAKQVHEKNFTNLIKEKEKRNSVVRNPNHVLINLTGDKLSIQEINVLKQGLNFSLALRPKEPQMIVAAEVLWNQITKNNLKLKTKNKLKLKTTLSSSYSIVVCAAELGSNMTS